VPFHAETVVKSKVPGYQHLTITSLLELLIHGQWRGPWSDSAKLIAKGPLDTQKTAAAVAFELNCPFLNAERAVCCIASAT
jgi:hypothetical protein